VSEILNRLREPSYNTFFAETLSAGLELLATHHIDLILLDPELPDSKGLDALAIIRRAPPTPNPVVALIRDGDEQLCRDVISEGASDYLVKGKFDDAMLGCVLHRVMLRWEAG
jgi:CheY-like chemotaxis protein